MAHLCPGGEMKKRLGLSEIEFQKIEGQISRGVVLNESLLGKIKKVATAEQLVSLMEVQDISEKAVRLPGFFKHY